MPAVPGSEPQIRASALKGLAELVERLGYPSRPLLRRLRLARSDLSRTDRFVPYTTFAEAVTDAAEFTATPHFGLLLARDQAKDISHAGTLGLLITHCATVGEAFDAMIHFYRTHSQGTRYALERDGDSAVLMRDSLVPSLRHNRQLQDMALVAFHEVLRVTTPSEWRADSVHFTYPRPADVRPYRKCFDCPLFFEQDVQAIAFGAATLKRPIETADPALKQRLQALLTTQLEDEERSFRNRVSEAIGSGLETGSCTVERIAAVFGVHSRTLHRRLRAEGTTFSDLVEARRSELATHYLRDTRMPLIQISMALGYKDPAIFTRAFRRWHGSAPSEWRARSKSRPIADLLRN